MFLMKTSLVSRFFECFRYGADRPSVLVARSVGHAHFAIGQKLKLHVVVRVGHVVEGFVFVRVCFGKACVAPVAVGGGALSKNTNQGVVARNDEPRVVDGAGVGVLPLAIECV